MEPTLEEIASMRLGGTHLVSKYLPFLLDVMQAEIESRPRQVAIAARLEAFKEQIRERQLMIDGTGI